MRSQRSRQGSGHPRLRRSALLGLLVVLGMACAAIAGLSAAGQELQEAGYEVHDLLMEEGDSVYADLERPDGATDVEHFEQAAAIIWDHLDDQAQQAEIRLRSPDDTDEIVTYSAAELEEIHQTRGS
ncbi:MAG: hypothetical protein EA340_12685 [Nitriliruptor sp.]|nr:MAG: hypothetical protein EA340_12685 [Nitriliruptor sp.]